MVVIFLLVRLLRLDPISTAWAVDRRKLREKDQDHLLDCSRCHSGLSLLRSLGKDFALLVRVAGVSDRRESQHSMQSSWAGGTLSSL